MRRSHRVSSWNQPQHVLKKPVPQMGGLYQRLLDRQLDNRMRCNFVKRSARERFSHFKLRQELDIFATRGGEGMGGMERRTRITEICTAEGTVFGLAKNGTCTAFDMETGKRICNLNLGPSEVVRSLFHNKSNGTLITVSVYADDHYSSLRCRSNPLKSLRQGIAHADSTNLFTSESLKYPGFVEFDDVNGKVLTYSAEDKMYKIWSMAEPSKVLYKLPDTQIEEIKISPGIMLLVLDRGGSAAAKATHIHLKILSIETGVELKELRQPIVKGKKIDIIEQFNEKLLLKQEGTPLHIVDLLKESVVKISDKRFATPSAFIFLYENQTFLAFKDNVVTVWNFRGELVSTFEDHTLWFPLPEIDHTSVIYITQSQDVIISLCEDPPDRACPGEQPAPVSQRVSVHVSNIMTGKCLAKVDWRRAGADPCHVTALCHNEETGDIITGNENGRLQVWSQ